MTTHFDVIKENVKKDVTIVYLEGDKIETIRDCRLLLLDREGVTFLDKKALGKNRITYVPSNKLIMIRQELI